MSIHHYLRAAAATLAISFVGPTLADQDDPRLPALFEALAEAAAPEDAAQVEQTIWQVWLEVAAPDAKSLLDAGMTSMNGGELSAAIAEFDTLVENAPDFAEGWNKRATALYMAGRYAESVRDIERTLRLEPRHFGALSGMGLIFMRSGDLEGALSAFEAVLKVHPQSVSARYHVETLRRQLGTPA